MHFVIWNNEPQLKFHSKREAMEAAQKVFRLARKTGVVAYVLVMTLPEYSEYRKSRE